MEYTNDVIFNVKYTEDKKWKTRIRNKIRNNKIFSIIIFSTIFFIILDCVLIIRFINFIKSI